MLRLPPARRTIARPRCGHSGAQALLEKRDDTDALIEHMIANPRLNDLGFYFDGHSSISGKAKWREAFGIEFNDINECVSDAVLQFAKERKVEIEKELRELGVELEETK
jgi:hypothetical protein